MELCTATPPLDLYDPSWPLARARRGLAPAKVAADVAGRKGVALEALVSDGAIIRGGMVLRSVVGPGVVVNSGAEVEDCVLLDGCHIGAGARLRRALVGVGVVIDAGAEVGYDVELAAPGEILPSGLTLVSPRPPGAAAAAH